MFTITDEDGELVAMSDDPRLLEVAWRWSGGPYIEYGLPGSPVGVVNVYDYEAGTPRLAFTADALADELERIYADDDAVEAVASEVAHG